MVMVKICGIRDAGSARACREAGADLAGLNFVEESRRRVTVEAAADLLPELGDVMPVGLFRGVTAREVRSVVNRLGLDWIQLHGNERAADFEDLAGSVRILRALSFEDATPDRLDEWRALGAIPLIDGPDPGSGRAFDWNALDFEGEFFIAGGLSPGNVAEAIRASGATGVDVASGVEVDGRIDEGLVVEFVRNARRESR
jgi:phosphoribosylanthranilate isomerase